MYVPLVVLMNSGGNIKKPPSDYKRIKKRRKTAMGRGSDGAGRRKKTT
jgi:hypothetical protein